MDFMIIATRTTKTGIEVFPKFIVGKSKDLMIKGGDFYAVWMEDKHLWSTDEQDVIDMIDRELSIYANNYREKFGVSVNVLYMWDSDSGIIKKWHTYCKDHMRDNFVPLNQNVIFANQEVKKEDYITTKLPYNLENGHCEAYDQIMNTLYAEEDRHKIEWCIGAIITGASKKLQKFLVLYGEKGTGKSTVINIIQQLFEGYYSVFDAKAVGSSNNTFALEPFKDNPLIAIQHDGDLSNIDDNTRLNSLTAHEKMIINEKHKATYELKIVSFLIMGTNNPVKITDIKSGIIRRLIDANPTGNKLPLSTYNKLNKQIPFELGHIAYRCKEVFEDCPNFYDNYTPTEMMGETNDFFNFVEDNYIVFRKDDRTTLAETWEMYKTYCDQTGIKFPMQKRQVKAELKSYFDKYFEDFQDPKTKQHVRNLYIGFRSKIFDSIKIEDDIIEEKNVGIDFKEQESIFDKECYNFPAQYASSAETPSKKWEKVTTTLKDIDTAKLHYVKVPENHIVIDFDLKDENGNKSFEKNLEAASTWPKTYAELSKSGCGIHLHYIYDGDVNQLSRIFDDDIEVKVFTGNSSLRRKLTKCNSEPINHICSGLPLKGYIDKMENIDIIKNEKVLRTMIKRNLNKEYHSATKPSVDYINFLLEQAYNSGVKYDVSDMYNVILAFASTSTHQADYCINLVGKMKFKSDESSESIDVLEKPIIFLDIEVFPNLLLINYKKEGPDAIMVRLINPSSIEVENIIMNYRIIGFNNRKYDNHILYAKWIGKSIEEIYILSKHIIDGKKEFMFGEAYNLSYTDVYDYSSKKQSLKKWEIELGIHHMELGLPWDKPVPKELWPKVSEYCDNDVISLEAVWLETQEDFLSRQILAEITGMSVNDTTNSITTKLIFGNDKKPDLVYTDLSETFPGYEFKKVYNEKTGKYDLYNMYRGIDLGLGGYVYAEPGMYGNVALLDVESLHPHSIIALNLFGKYTKNFSDLVDTRIFVKHGQFEEAKKLFDGKLVKFLDDPSVAPKLAKALKLAINSVYGLTSAKFNNPFRDERNENNIVALRGALFMKTLQDEVTARGFKVIHIKTDSIKIPDATPEIVDFCMQFAHKYGYNFEHEATYERITLVNDAVYIAKFATEDQAKALYSYAPKECVSDGGLWTATGTQFQIPYVFKTCFSKEKIIFDDMCETKEVKTAMYLDFNEGKMDTTKLEQELYVITNGNREPERQEEIRNILAENHDRKFIGKVGLFCPIKPGMGGAELVVERTKELKNIGQIVCYDSVTGAKGYRWLEAESVKDLSIIDRSYYEKLVNTAIETISKYGDYNWFTSDDPYIPGMLD